MQKSVAFLYKNNELSPKGIKKTIPFTIASERTTNLGVNLIKEVKICTLTTIKYRWNKLKKSQINGKIFHVYGSEELILLRCPYYPKQSTDSMQFLLQYQWHLQ